MKSKTRTTKQLTEVLKILEKNKGPVSALEVLKLAKKKAPLINKTTIYRILDRLVKEKVVEAIMLQEGTVHYEKISNRKHHHHFVCLECSTIYCIDGCVSGLQKMLPKGFSLVNHEVTLRGICKSCS